MNFYIVGFNSLGGSRVLGDALVYASTLRNAQSLAREKGLVPILGDTYILGSKNDSEYQDSLGVSDYMKEKAREEGVIIIWSDNG